MHKSPANAVVHGALRLEAPVDQARQDVLNPKGVDCLRDLSPAGKGIRVWGARTMASDAQWGYISIRRLVIFLEQSIQEGTQWVVFEPNDAST